MWPGFVHFVGSVTIKSVTGEGFELGWKRGRKEQKHCVIYSFAQS